MRILVAGGCGYIGSSLVPVLQDRGYEIVVVDLLWFGNHLPEGTAVIQKDVFKLTEKDLSGYDQVIFMAGLSNDPMAEYSPSMNFIFNASAPAYLAYVAKRAGVKRYVFASSCSVYGYTVNELYDEESPAISNYPYGISKLQGEQAVLHMVDKRFSVVCLRQGTVCGYSPRMRLDLIVNTMFKTALQDGKITVDNPSIWRPVLSIEDAANAYIRAIESDYDINGIFNIASGNYTVGEVADIVKASIERNFKKRITLDIRQMKDFRNYKVSIEKAAKILSYKPRHEIENILENLRVNLDRFSDFSNPNYYNIQVFKALGERDWTI
jgi:nucleoside-diphosphate-sugar epimerase